MDILQQLGNLILGSVPTMILFVLLILAYGLLVRQPLDRVLAQRREQTTGAVEQARGAIAAAEAETTVFEDKLRAARAELFAMREKRVAGWNAERERTLGEVRTLSAERVQAAKAEIEAGTLRAKQQIEGAGGDLVARVLAAIVPGARAQEGTAQ